MFEYFKNQKISTDKKEAVSPLPTVQLYYQIRLNVSPRKDVKAMNGSFCSKFHTLHGK